MQYSARAREHMISSQLLPGQVLDTRVLEALAAVPREEFVKEGYKLAAYADEPVKVCENRYMLDPLTFARLLMLADIQPHDKVLDVGSMKGYSVAVISRLAEKVVALEEQRELADQARTRLQKLASSNVEMITGALMSGYSSTAPYDVIVIEGGVQYVPEGLLAQLKPGGRLVCVLKRPVDGAAFGLGQSLLIHRTPHGFERHEGDFDMVAPLLEDFVLPVEFIF